MSEIPTDVPAGLSDAFAADQGKRIQWRAFIAKNGLDAIELDEVVFGLRAAFERLGVWSGSSPRR